VASDRVQVVCHHNAARRDTGGGSAARFLPAGIAVAGVGTGGELVAQPFDQLCRFAAWRGAHVEHDFA